MSASLRSPRFFRPRRGDRSTAGEPWKNDFERVFLDGESGVELHPKRERVFFEGESKAELLWRSELELFALS